MVKKGSKAITKDRGGKGIRRKPPPGEKSAFPRVTGPARTGLALLEGFLA